MEFWKRLQENSIRQFNELIEEDQDLWAQICHKGLHHNPKIKFCIAADSFGFSSKESQHFQPLSPLPAEVFDHGHVPVSTHDQALVCS